MTHLIKSAKRRISDLRKFARSLSHCEHNHSDRSALANPMNAALEE